MKRPVRSPRCYPDARPLATYFLPNNRGKKSVTEVGRGADTITVIRTPARYASFRAVVTDPPPTAGEHNAVFLARP